MHIKSNLSTYILLLLIVMLSIWSLLLGPIKLRLDLLFNPLELELILISRAPRLAAVICSGLALSIAGLIMQNLCMNKFMSPSTGATIQASQLGLLFALLFLPNSSLFGKMLFSFSVALVVTCLFIYFLKTIQHRNIILVPLIGIMFGNIISGITSFLAFKYDLTQALAGWTMGHFSSVIRGRYELVYIIIPVILLALYFINYFNIVGLGKNFAYNLGVNYNLFLFMGLAIASLLTAVIVTVVGAISYVGLIIPNLVSIYKGDNLKNTVLDTGLAGICFLLFCDIISRLVIAPYELPINLIVASIGSIVFIILIFYRLESGVKKNLSVRQRFLITIKSFLVKANA